ncbi:hypothetical protein F5Y07DRAFT_403539 [Xylaria sp. FL0933]|nr:hypothetical protein F5Y07DRAFT_403539 [Xylaria sp. FL0933]
MAPVLYEFWQCGHITKVDDGTTVSENGKLTPRLQRHRKFIKIYSNDICASCHTKKLGERLQDIRTLMCESNPRREAMMIVDRRIAAVKKFLESDPEGRFRCSTVEFDNYPPEFLKAEHYALQLELEACQTAIEGFVAARQQLLRSVKFTSTLIDRTTHIGDAALAWSEDYLCKNKAVRDCLFEIMRETGELAEEIQRDQVMESRYLVRLDAEARSLRDMLDEYGPEIGERFGGLLDQVC